MNAYLNIIIPTYNSGNSIEILVAQLQKKLSSFDFRIIFVDDFSTDNTPASIVSLAERNDNISYHLSETNLGQQASLRIGLRMIKHPCKFVVTMDDDLQNPVEVLETLISKIEAGYDLVYAIPMNDDDPKESCLSLTRRFGSRLRDSLFESFINKPLGIKVSSYRIMTYDLAVRVAASETKFFYLSAEIFQHRVRVANIYYHFVPRRYGQSGYRLKKLLLIYVRLLLTYKLKLV